MLFAIAGIFYLLGGVAALAGLVFFVLIVIQMFKRDQSTLGIICIVLTLCTGLGPLVAFIYGWTKATEWDIKKTMMYWTICFVLQFVFFGIAAALAVGGAATMDPVRFEMEVPSDMTLDIDMDDSTFGQPDAFPQPGTDGGQPDAFPQPGTDD